MRRREERLKYWLDSANQAQKQKPLSGLAERLLLGLRLRQSSGSIHAESLALNTGTVSLDDALVAAADVRDGFGALDASTQRSSKSVDGSADCAARIESVVLLQNAGVCEMRLPNEKSAHIRVQKVDLTSICRQFLLKVPAAQIIELHQLRDQPPQLRDGARFLITDPLMMTLTSKMAELPHTRISVSVEDLHDSERTSFLREAEALKGLSGECAELLAVFRNVPIEVISRLRFLEEKKAIVYTVSRETQVTKTRVHDLGVVRNIENREIHLVPHRTRFRSVALN